MNKTFTIISVAEAFSALAENKGSPVSGFGFRSCPDAPYVECLLAGARASATDASPYRFLDGSGHWWSSCARVKITSPIAKGHNPRSLTEEQVGVSGGWRLLTKKEHDSNTWVRDAEFFSLLFGGWTRLSNVYAGQEAVRTKHPEGYYLPKPKIAEGFNPRGLTVEQVGEGYRLLTKEEIAARPADGGIDFWRAGWTDFFDVVSFNEEDRWMFRTQKPAGYFLPKVPQYVPWTFETAPKGHVMTRAKHAAATHAAVVVGWNTGGLKILDGYYPWQRLIDDKIEHSLDGGKTWSPAATEVRS